MPRLDRSGSARPEAPLLLAAPLLLLLLLLLAPPSGMWVFSGCRRSSRRLPLACVLVASCTSRTGGGTLSNDKGLDGMLRLVRKRNLCHWNACWWPFAQAQQGHEARGLTGLLRLVRAQ